MDNKSASFAAGKRCEMCNYFARLRRSSTVFGLAIVVVSTSCRRRPAAALQPGVVSPSVEMPLSTIDDGSTPSSSAVCWMKAAAKAAASGSVAISSRDR